MKVVLESPKDVEWIHKVTPSLDMNLSVAAIPNIKMLIFIREGGHFPKIQAGELK